MRRQKRFIQSSIFTLAICALACANAFTVTAAGRIRFKVGINAALASAPVSGRLLIFMTNQAKPLEMIEPDFLNPRSVYLTGLEIRNLEPGKPIEVDPDALSFPAPFSTAPAGDYQLMALLDLDHSYTYDGTGAGDLYSAISTIHNLKPSSSPTIELTLAKRVPEQTVSDTDSIKLVNFESPSLTKFWGRPIMMQAGVVLPPSYGKSAARRYPVVYDVHGYGGTHLTAWQRGPKLVQQMAAGTVPERIYGFLNAKFPLVLYVFVESVTHCLSCHELTAELIPDL